MDTLKLDRELYEEGRNDGVRRNKVPRQIEGGRSWARGAHVTFPGFAMG